MNNNDNFINRDIFHNVDILIEQNNELIRVLKEKTNNLIKISNVGITYNNKLVEINQLYKRRGLDISKSSLILLIQRYLQNLLVDALKCITKYTDFIKEKVNTANIKNDAIRLMEEAEKFLRDYKDNDKLIFYFTIEKNIFDALFYDIECWNEIGQEGGYNLYQNNPEIIEEYNKELKDLGFDITIPLIDTQDEEYKKQLL